MLKERNGFTRKPRGGGGGRETRPCLSVLWPRVINEATHKLKVSSERRKRTTLESSRSTDENTGLGEEGARGYHFLFIFFTNKCM